MGIFISLLIFLAKLGFFVYVLFGKPKDVTFYRNCYYASITFLIFALLECVFGSIPYISLIVWGILTYMNRNEYLKLKNGSSYDDKY